MRGRAGKNFPGGRKKRSSVDLRATKAAANASRARLTRFFFSLAVALQPYAICAFVPKRAIAKRMSGCATRMAQSRG
ncbi:hypothetical protein CQW49_20100 [Methylosinus trichosporium OB3b]|uniref:Uncharacterized protein n=1 Tax=Methylosinus trichosporium (strain ATCC 35070 / NCIMB 11131 / UNIQEM 75 / OB3b) TaxID=595536 RepID=A0A2D2D4J7_METT3|nr:hypothetical protein CQW49_20100 [Methylosinus trichosporium OB3b]OBS53856.1 hypothetical protein A8B73_03555 [Methylosinus sp. 3S-1]